MRKVGSRRGGVRNNRGCTGSWLYTRTSKHSVMRKFTECPECELRLIDFLQSSRRHNLTRFYLSFTKGLRPFNSKAQRRVYSCGGPGSTVLFLSQLPEFVA